ncbi:MAG: hypothetical protein IJ667_06705 [Synergistaceae bacterium]|nr:hypothetical protein [Synergistaceae bacterium]
MILINKFYRAIILCALLLSVKINAACAKDSLSVVIFPTINSTGIEIWESKFYPYNILDQKMSDYLESLFKRSPAVEVRVLDEAGMNNWLAGSRRGDDIAVQLELFNAVMKERHVVGNFESARAQFRLRVYSANGAKQLAVRTVEGRDRRFTLDSAEDVFWFNVVIKSLPKPFDDGLDLFGLTNTNYKGQKMSKLTWDQFKNTSHWQAFKNAIEECFNQSMSQINSALGKPGETFSPSFATIGRIISPYAKTKRHRREYIISLGSQARPGMVAVSVGEILDVVRPDTYVTVDPENPIAVLPNKIGQVKVIKVYDQNAVVRVIKDSKKEPITLEDIVIKTTQITRARKKGIL